MAATKSRNADAADDNMCVGKHEHLLLPTPAVVLNYSLNAGTVQDNNIRLMLDKFQRFFSTVQLLHS